MYNYENGDNSSSIYRTTYPIIRYTPKCFVIDAYGNEKFVLKDARKRFAYPTDELAIESLLARLGWRLRYANAAVTKAEHCIVTLLDATKEKEMPQ